MDVQWPRTHRRVARSLRPGGVRPFFFNDTATTEIYTLSLHDALPIFSPTTPSCSPAQTRRVTITATPRSGRDRKSTRLNSSHSQISYAAFCLKKKITDTSAETGKSVRIPGREEWTLSGDGLIAESRCH